MAESAPILLIDTYSLLFRAHHALPPMCTTRGEPTGALYGLSALLLKLIREQRPLGLGFALDTARPTFRHERYAAYKATRSPVASVLSEQLRRLAALLAAFGGKTFAAPGYEADDVLASLARELVAAQQRPLIVSGDRDLLQLVSEHVHVLFVGARGQAAVLYDLERVRARFGIEPGQLPTWTALVGDSSDNLPGVPGIGPATAARLVKEYGNASNIVGAGDGLRPVRLAQAVRSAAGSLEAHEDLARLRDDVPLDPGPRYAELGETSWAALRALFDELEFKSLTPRLAALIGDAVAPSRRRG